MVKIGLSQDNVKVYQNISNQSNIAEKQDISFTAGKLGKKNTRVKPKFFKLLGQVINNHMDGVLGFLDLPDLAKTRSVNKLFLTIVHEYYPKRLKYEVESIKTFQEYNYDYFEEFMKIIDSQIPLSNKNWLDFDLNSVIKKIKVLDKKTVTDLKGIKNLGKLTEAIYAPLCIIFGYNKTSNSSIKSDGWKKIAHKLLNETDFHRKLQNLDLDNMNDADMLDAFVYLNLPEIEIDNIKKYSPVLEKLTTFCQAVVSYHVLIHPFIYRNDKTPQMLPGSEMHNFVVTMNKMLNRFYKFKRFLINLNIMSIPLAEYVFNLQHNREEKVPQESLIKTFDETILGSILSFIPHSESNKLMSVSRKWKDGFKVGMDYVINEILKEIFYLKIQATEKLYKRLPILYDNNIFSNYFLMIDDLLNGENLFLSKEQINDIKNIKIENETFRTVAKIACTIFNEKPNRKSTSTGDIQILYLDRIKLLSINGQLNKIMKNINKLDLNQTVNTIFNQKINQIQLDISNYASLEKLEEIKKMNRGIYQLLIWELFVFEYHKLFNPFEFISSDLIISKFDREDVDIIKYYCEVMNYLKFNLKLKFKFNKGNYDFKRLFEDLKQNLFLQKVNTELVFDTSQEYSKISKIYFETKDLIPPAAKPAFFERIYNEILKVSGMTNKRNVENLNEISGVGYSGLNVGSLGTIREESSINEKIMLDRQYNNKDKVLLNHFFPKSNLQKKPVSYNDVPNELIIKHFLFFLDINSLPKFSMSNKKSNECVKTHLFIRLHFLNKEKKIIEQENNEIISSIEEKRKEFFEEYEILPPKYEHATQLMQSISNNDIIELKQCFKKYNKNYEEFVSPVVILFGQKAQTQIKPDGTKISSFFYPTQKLLNSNDFFKKLMNFELETIPQQRFKNISKILESPNFNLERIKQLSPCLHNLLMWVMGVIEFHKVIRKYSLSSYDYDILTEEEINFSSEMDNIMLLYYKLLRYANTFCKNYEKVAQQIMVSMNIISEKK